MSRRVRIHARRVDGTPRRPCVRPPRPGRARAARSSDAGRRRTRHAAPAVRHRHAGAGRRGAGGAEALGRRGMGRRRRAHRDRRRRRVQPDRHPARGWSGELVDRPRLHPAARHGVARRPRPRDERVDAGTGGRDDPPRDHQRLRPRHRLRGAGPVRLRTRHPRRRDRPQPTCRRLRHPDHGAERRHQRGRPGGQPVRSRRGRALRPDRGQPAVRHLPLAPVPLPRQRAERRRDVSPARPIRPGSSHRRRTLPSPGVVGARARAGLARPVARLVRGHGVRCPRARTRSARAGRPRGELAATDRAA